MTTYLFYDLETTGLNKAFDQIVQFSAIRTDAAFKEIERKNLIVRLRPDTVISPGALITHRLGISQTQAGLSEYEAIQEIHQLLNTPGTVSLGYNTMGFDDEFLRFSFHRNLLPPYTHQYSNQCRRMDILPLAVIYYLYKNEVMNWPELNGKPTLKLEHLSAANQLAGGRAHDAETDVVATVAMTQIFSRNKKMWNYLGGYFNKSTDAERIAQLPMATRISSGNHSTGLVVGAAYGAEQKYQAPVLYLGNSIPYSNQTLWLRLDLPALQETTRENVAESTWIIRKRLGDPPIILPPLPRYLALIEPERKQLARDNLSWLAAHPDIFREIIKYHQNFRYPEIPDLDPDAALYQLGFLSQSEARICRRFHAAAPTEKARIVEQFPTEEIRQLAARILFRNFPEHAPPAGRPDFERYMKRVNAGRAEDALRDYKGERRMTPAEALLEIDELKSQEHLDTEQQALLAELKTYLQQMFTKAPSASIQAGKSAR